MRIERADACLKGAMLAAFTVLAAGASHGESCLDSASSVQSVPAGTRDYAFRAGRAADGGNGLWGGLLPDGIEFTGSVPGCWVNGEIDGEFEENIAYECTSEHSPSQCVCHDGGYHTTSGMRPDGPDPIPIEDVAIKNYGDGISVGAGSGDVIARGVLFENLHDDAMETDYAQQSLICRDCLFNRVFMAQAYRRRSSASGNAPKPGLTMELRNSLVRLHRFTCSYKMKAGHGGVWKDDSYTPKFIVTDNVFLMGPVAGSGQKLWPTNPVECRNNVVLWQGTQSAWDSVKGGMPTSCYKAVVKPASQSEAQFRAAPQSALNNKSWDQLVTEWKNTHAAGGGTPAPPPGPGPGPGPAPGPGSPPQEPILLP